MINAGAEIREPQFVRVPLHPPPNTGHISAHSRVVIYAPYLSGAGDDPERPPGLLRRHLYGDTENSPAGSPQNDFTGS